MSENILIKLPDSSTELQFTTELVQGLLLSVFRCSECHRIVFPGDKFYNDSATCGRHKKKPSSGKKKPSSGKKKASPQKKDTGRKKRSPKKK
jgi:hypothetical protein